MGAVEQRQIITAHITATRTLRTELEGLIRALFGEFTTWRGPQATVFARQAAPIIVGAQRDMADLTAVYLGSLLDDMTGADPFDPVDLGDDLRGVPTEDVYERPFRQLWADLADGRPLDDAVQAAERRAVNLAVTDLELSQTRTSQALLEQLAAMDEEDEDDDGGAVGYRRVLTGAENCGLCVVASTQRYHVRDLLPIHPGCDCAVAPILGDMDPGQVINSVMLTEGAEAAESTRSGVPIYTGDDLIDVGELLEPIHDAVQATFGESARDARQLDYRKVMTTYEHGELGPVLKVRRHDHTGPADVA